MAIIPFNMTLVWAEMIAPEVRHFAFQLTEKQELAYIPGQFITLHIPHEEKPLRRSYSIATVPGQSDYIELAAGYVKNGPGSQFLFNLQPGDTVQTTGPFGRLILRDESPKRYILVATSTGVTPYRSMLPALEERLRDSSLKIEVLQGVRNRASLLYGEEFARFAGLHPNFTFRAHYSRDFPNDPHSYEHQGYVQNAFSTLDLDPNADIVYLCGNPAMIDEAYASLQNLGFTTTNVRREKYISAK